MAIKAYIGLGSNLGDPIEQLLKARRLLSGIDSVVSINSSAIYSSSPVGYDDQPDFVNCVVELVVSCSYRPLFERMQSIEADMGRWRDPENQNAPRLIDIDLLLFGDQLIDEPDLIVPHPRIHQRLFVLLPLEELAPDLAYKMSRGQLADLASAQAKQNRIAALQASFPGQKLVRLSL